MPAALQGVFSLPTGSWFLSLALALWKFGAGSFFMGAYMVLSRLFTATSLASICLIVVALL